MAKTKDEAEIQADAEQGLDATGEVKAADKGLTAYPHDRLIEDAWDFFQQPSHVLAGALHDNPKEYLTLKEAEAAIAGFLSHEVSSTEEES